MTEFHKEYQHVFSEGASIRTIMKRRISHVNLLMPESVCEDKMQSTNLDSNEVIIEYITDAHGNKIKKLKPLFNKSKPDRNIAQHVINDDDLPAVLEGNFTQKRKVTIYSYSESISSNDEESSDDGTVTADSDSFAASTSIQNL